MLITLALTIGFRVASFIAAATSFTDPGPLTESLYCYILMPVVGSPPAALATSDVLCVVRAIAAGTSFPTNFTLRLQSGTAALSWQLAGGQDSFMLMTGNVPAGIAGQLGDIMLFPKPLDFTQLLSAIQQAIRSPHPPLN